jgi:hypothetical protein
MTRADLIARVESVESVEAADRELDAAIALALGIVTERDGDCFYGHKDYSVMVLERSYYDIEGSAPELPHYTTSLDAAMMLVPEGWSVGLGDLRGYDPIIWRAHLRDHRPESLTKAGHSHIWREGHAATPALALVAACLRAGGE